MPLARPLDSSDFSINGRMSATNRSCSGKEPGDHRESVSDAVRGRRLEPQRNSFAGQPTAALSLNAFTSNSGNRVREMLLDEGNLGLHRELDILKPGRWSEVGSNSRQNPRAPFLVHQTPCAID